VIGWVQKSFIGGSVWRLRFRRQNDYGPQWSYCHISYDYSYIASRITSTEFVQTTPTHRRRGCHGEFTRDARRIRRNAQLYSDDECHRNIVYLSVGGDLLHRFPFCFEFNADSTPFIVEHNSSNQCVRHHRQSPTIGWRHQRTQVCRRSAMHACGIKVKLGCVWSFIRLKSKIKVVQYTCSTFAPIMPSQWITNKLIAEDCFKATKFRLEIDHR
jgi:hypothetical protein